MPHVLRHPDGSINSLHRDPVPGAEWLEPDHPDVAAFLGAGAGFAELDANLIRVVEDLVDVLVARNIIRVTDLPAEAQQKLFARKGFRDGFRRNALRLYDDGDGPADGLVGRFDTL